MSVWKIRYVSKEQS